MHLPLWNRYTTFSGFFSGVKWFWISRIARTGYLEVRVDQTRGEVFLSSITNTLSCGPAIFRGLLDWKTTLLSLDKFKNQSVFLVVSETSSLFFPRPSWLYSCLTVLATEVLVHHLHCKSFFKAQPEMQLNKAASFPLSIEISICIC